MSSKWTAIFELFKHEKRQWEIVRLLNIPGQTVSDAICRFEDLGNVMTDVQEVGENVLLTLQGIARTLKASPKRAASQRWDRFLFTDEKLFMVQQAYNHQNDRIWTVDSSSPSAMGSILETS
ncbi:paired domain-containing protein [Trichonephila clavipes]|nr:paired domain-containing protein [Trichonephila clavipes]